jgi:hypothetical protein
MAVKQRLATSKVPGWQPQISPDHEPTDNKYDFWHSMDQNEIPGVAFDHCWLSINNCLNQTVLIRNVGCIVG